jgi:hypothetical protein
MKHFRNSHSDLNKGEDARSNNKMFENKNRKMMN